MPSKRSSNEAKQKTRSTQKSPQESDYILEAGARNDIYGVMIAILGIITLIAVLVPSSALLTTWISDGLHMILGIGAIIIPIALILWALTFFIDTDSKLPARAGLGLLIIMLALVTFIAVYTPGAAEDAMLIFDPRELSARGGYIGGAMAWALIKLIGTTGASVFIVGLILTGLIVLGFSLSGLVERVLDFFDRQKQKAYERQIDRAYPVEEVQEKPEETEVNRPRLIDKVARIFTKEQDDVSDDAAYIPDEAEVEASTKTSYLGTRTKTRAFEQADKATSRKASSSRKTSRTSPQKKESQGQAGQAGQAEKKAPQTSGRPSATEGFELPDPAILVTKTTHFKLTPQQEQELNDTQEHLQETLETFGMTARVVGWTAGPTVTTYRVAMGEGERVNKLTNLEDDIALALAASAVRIFSPIPGTSLVGVEIPNKNRVTVTLGDVMPFVKGGPLMLAIGRDVEGNPLTADLAKMPHLLIAGTTGSGKSVMINSIISTILMRATPNEVRLIMVDPKRVELSGYNGIPQLYVPVVTDPRQAASSLQWAVAEMERRLKVFEKAQARNIASYNALVQSGKFDDEDVAPEEMPYLVIVIDELTDLMMVAGKDVEASIVRISQLGRAAGIHLIVATQRPAAEVVTNAIKVNIVNRIAFKVATSVDSRVILGQGGAEKLTGLGDMLFDDGHSMKPSRLQGCFVSDEEIAGIISHLREQGEPEYHEEILSVVLPSQASASTLASTGVSSDDDPLIWDAAEAVIQMQMGSTSGIQRRLRVGYARAGRIMDMLEDKGIVGPADGTKPREVLVSKEELDTLRAFEEQDTLADEEL
ncbi:MAG: DNA translocase FtsK 4TM domain-containing protein [Coriobacteriia bacterium]|nr:DNA translocase FtsK 4TM domain-containing protein [Coriobacteriia bacterium]